MKLKFWEKENPLTKFDPHVAAYAVFRRMVDRKEPFNEWRPEGEPIPGEADACVELFVWAYQLQVYLDLLEKKFGPDIAKIVESHLLILMNKGDGSLGTSMRRWFDVIRAARYSQEHDERIDPAIQVDCNIAKALLKTISASEEEKAAIFFYLGHSLTLGRIIAEIRFGRLVDSMQFRPESIIGVRKAEESAVRWSDAPGCFERHLQRRFRNPLFPLNRRDISSSELADAQARDAADFASFFHDFDGMIRGACSDDLPQTFSTHLKLRKETEELLVRAAEIGAIAQKQKASLQDFYATIVKTLRDGCATEEVPALEQALQTSYQLQRTHTNDFVAQLERKDGPISGAEVLPSVLSEDVETVRLVVEVFDESLLTAMRRLTTELLAEARAEDYVLQDGQEKLSAMGVLAVGD